MPRATNKTQLLEDSHAAYQKLTNYVEKLSPQEMEMTGVVGDWSVKDVLAHLAEWHEMVMHWYDSGLKGETPAVPGEGYTWRSLPALNQMIYEKHHARSLEDIQTWFQGTHQKTIQIVESRSDEDLFTRGLYPWMNNNTLAAYFIANLSSHYTWALKEIRAGMKRKTKTQA